MLGNACVCVSELKVKDNNCGLLVQLLAITLSGNEHAKCECLRFARVSSNCIYNHYATCSELSGLPCNNANYESILPKQKLLH